MCWCGSTPCRDTAAEFWGRVDGDPDEFLRVETAAQRGVGRLRRNMWNTLDVEDELEEWREEAGIPWWWD